MKPGAGLLITNARVWTAGRVDERVDAVAVAGGRVLAVGRGADLEPLLRPDTGRRAWGARVERSYPWRSLLEAGASVVFGSDAPVEAPVPALGLHAALTRQRVDSKPAGGFSPWECIGLDQALLAHTCGGAAPAGRSAGLGRIAPGCTTDLVVWDADIHRLPATMLHKVRPACTLLAGEAVYRGPPARQQEVFSLRRDS